MVFNSLEFCKIMSQYIIKLVIKKLKKIIILTFKMFILNIKN